MTRTTASKTMYSSSGPELRAALDQILVQLDQLNGRGDRAELRRRRQSLLRATEQLGKALTEEMPTQVTAPGRFAPTAAWALDWLRRYNALVRFESAGTVTVTIRGSRVIRRRRPTVCEAIRAVEQAMVAAVKRAIGPDDPMGCVLREEPSR